MNVRFFVALVICATIVAFVKVGLDSAFHRPEIAFLGGDNAPRGLSGFVGFHVKH